MIRSAICIHTINFFLPTTIIMILQGGLDIFRAGTMVTILFFLWLSVLSLRLHKVWQWTVDFVSGLSKLEETIWWHSNGFFFWLLTKCSSWTQITNRQAFSKIAADTIISKTASCHFIASENFSGMQKMCISDHIHLSQEIHNFSFSISLVLTHKNITSLLLFYSASTIY